MKLLLVFALGLLSAACIQPTPPELYVWPRAGCPQDYLDFRADRWTIYAQPYQGAAKFPTPWGWARVPDFLIEGYVDEGRTEFTFTLRDDDISWTEELRIGPPEDFQASFTPSEAVFAILGASPSMTFSSDDSERILRLLKDLEALGKPAVFSSANGEHRSYFYLKGLSTHLERFESCWETPAE